MMASLFQFSMYFWYIRIVGVNDAEGPPVPISNTEVKLSRAEDTCLETDRENRSTPTLIFLLSSAGRARGC